MRFHIDLCFSSHSHFYQIEEKFVGQRNYLSFCSCEKPYFQTPNEISAVEAERREKHTHTCKILPVGLSITYEANCDTPGVPQKRKEKAINTHLDRHTSQACQQLTAVTTVPCPQGGLCLESQKSPP